jgi:CysZ protein
MIFSSLSKAIAQATDPAFRGVFLKALGITIAVLIGAVIAVGYLVGSLGAFTLPLIGVVDPGATAGIVSALLTLLLSVFLMLPVASIVIGFFLDDIASAVEDRHFPTLPPAERLSLSDAFVDALRFFGVVVGANLAALIVYLIFLPLAPFIFYGLNGYLLGREYFQLVALRRLPAREVAALRQRNKGVIWGMGVMLALPLSIPFAGVVVPLIGVAAFTHLFHRVVAR